MVNRKKRRCMDTAHNAYSQHFIFLFSYQNEQRWSSCFLNKVLIVTEQNKTGETASRKSEYDRFGGAAVAWL